MPVDPVCGIELEENLALIHEHDGKKYYFCCNGCRKIFIKNQENGRKIIRTDSFHTFYKTLCLIQLKIDNLDT